MSEAAPPVGGPGASVTALRRWLEGHERLAVAVFAALLALLFGARLLRSDPISLNEDWDYTQLTQWIAVQSVTDFGQFPLFTPYTCGGMGLLGNPQSRVMTPWFLFHLLFGVDIGIRLELIVHVAFAFAGAYYLARVAGLSRTASFVSGLVFPICSFHYAHFAVGHAATALPQAYLPWPLAFALRALELRRASFAACAGAVIALMFGEGGAYATAYSFLALAAVLGWAAVARRSWEPLRVLALVLVFTAAFGAAKFALTYEVMQSNPRHTQNPDGFFPLLMLRALFSRNQDLLQRHAYQRWSWHEYSAYVSPFFMLLAILGAVLERRRTRVYAACVALFAALAVGYLFSIWETPPRPLESPWTLLHRIPPFNSLRVPARLMVLVVLFLGLLAGFGVDALRQRLSARRFGLVLALAGLSVVDAWLVGTGNLEYAFGSKRDSAPLPAPPAGPFAQHFDREPPLMEGDDGPATRRMAAVVHQGYGVLNCYEPIRPRRAAIAPDEDGYRGEQYLVGAGTSRLVEWTPQRLTFDVSAPAGATLVVNQNFDAHFRLEDGQGRVVSHGGLLAVELPPGPQRVTLAYVCWSFWLGLLAALGATLATVLLWRRERKRGALS